MLHGHTFREARAAWLTGGLHLLILFGAVKAESRAVWPYALAAMAAVSLVAWMANYRRYRHVHDIPTSRIASAAQGYVELVGRSEPIEDHPVVSPVSGRACCWYSYCIERRSGNDWHHEDSGQSVEHFLLVDASGRCVVSPEGAEVLYASERTWENGGLRYTESMLLPHGTLYALGEFTTVSGEPEADERSAVSELLAEWKKDRKALLERFDANRDGAVDLQEWEAARLEAQREVRRNRAHAPQAAGLHLLREPADGRVFILAAGLPDHIGRRFKLWSWTHLALFFVTGAGAWLLSTRGGT